MTSNRTVGYVALAAFISTVFAANWLIEHVGIVSVGFGLVAPAGVFAAGLAFTFRDLVHETLGVAGVIVGILVGAALSYLISPAFAVASAVAFLASEAADLAVYAPLRERTKIGAVALSNTVGAVVDSMIFLTIAFGSLEFLWGQVVGKSWVTLATVAVLAAGRALVSRPEPAR